MINNFVFRGASPKAFFLGDDLKFLGLPLFSKAISLNKLVQFFFLRKNLYSRFAPGKTEDKAILVY